MHFDEYTQLIKMKPQCSKYIGEFSRELGSGNYAWLLQKLDWFRGSVQMMSGGGVDYIRIESTSKTPSDVPAQAGQGGVGRWLWVPGGTVAAGAGWGEVGDGKPLGMSLFQSF